MLAGLPLNRIELEIAQPILLAAVRRPPAELSLKTDWGYGDWKLVTNEEMCN